MNQSQLVLSICPPDAAEETRLSRAFTYQDRLSLRSSGNNQWSGFVVWNTSNGNRGNGFEDIEIDKLLPQVPLTMDETARDALWRQRAVPDQKLRVLGAVDVIRDHRHRVAFAEFLIMLRRCKRLAAATSEAAQAELGAVALGSCGTSLSEAG